MVLCLVNSGTLLLVLLEKMFTSYYNPVYSTVRPHAGNQLMRHYYNIIILMTTIAIMNSKSE